MCLIFSSVKILKNPSFAVLPSKFEISIISMEDSFRVRLDKAFGSLTSSATSDSSLSTLWCLTDDEIERREWNRDRDILEPNSGPSSSFADHRQRPLTESKYNYRSELERDLQDLDYDEEQQGLGSAKPDDYNDEEWEIKSSIGLDPTLDYEEEEDEYDKVAIGKENAGDCLFMRNVTEYGIEVDSSNTVPNSFKEVTKDPRANLLAAKIRLKEDAEAAEIRFREDVEAAKKFDSLRVSEEDAPNSMDAETDIAKDGVNAKSIKSVLKRKDNQSESRSQKRVRFNLECVDNCNKGTEPDSVENIPTESYSVEGNNVVQSEEASLAEDHPSVVPDYLCNPSKYTYYTFNSSSDIDEESNKQAFMDFYKLLKKSPLEDTPIDDLKSVTFIPRKKIGDAVMVENHSDTIEQQAGIDKDLHQRGTRIGIAAADAIDNDICVIEGDETETIVRDSLQKQRRQYRTKSRQELD